ncbi:MAG: MarR family transcriptional regulator [Actinobacteria bacterium]|nr:MAG: MarR family transcriptional regulator [Actinomycetota bacterium]
MSIDTKIDTKTTPRLPAELVASNVFLLKRLGFAAKSRSLEVYEQEGLNPYHYAILALLDEGMPETQAAIADALGYDRGTLVGLLDELEEHGLVERKRDPDDRRRHLVRLTGDGKQTLGRLRAFAQRVEEEFLAPLDAEQRETLHALLLELAAKHEPRCAPPS